MYPPSVCFLLLCAALCWQGASGFGDAVGTAFRTLHPGKVYLVSGEVDTAEGTLHPLVRARAHPQQDEPQHFLLHFDPSVREIDPMELRQFFQQEPKYIPAYAYLLYTTPAELQAFAAAATHMDWLDELQPFQKYSPGLPRALEHLALASENLTAPQVMLGPSSLPYYPPGGAPWDPVTLHVSLAE
eukprot:RCo002805